MAALVRARITNGAMLAIVLETMKDATDTVCFEFSKAGLLVRTMDEGSNVKIFFHLKAHYMSQEYMCNRDTVIWIKLPVVLKYLKLATKEGGLEMICTEDEKLHLTFLSTDENARTFTLNSLNISTDQNKIKEIISRPTGEIKMPSNCFASNIRKLASNAETLMFQAQKYGFRGEKEPTALQMKATNKVGVEGLISAVANQHECFVKFHDGPFTFTYSTRYLKEFIKGSKLSNDVSLKFSKHCNTNDRFHVLMLEYAFLSSSTMLGGYLRFYLRNQ